MAKLPYGYKWILRLCISTALAQLWIWMAYPEFDQELFPAFQYYHLESVIYLIADAVRYFIIVDFLFQITDLISRETERKEYGKSLGYVLSAIPVIFIFFTFWKLYSNGKEFFVVTENLKGQGKAVFNFLWDNDRDDFFIFLAFSVVIPLSINNFPPFILERIQELREHRLFRQIFKEGRGGSAQWATTPTYERFKAEAEIGTNKILLGRSLLEDDPKTKIIGIDDDAHMITSGITGSGKSTTVLLPNLAAYGGSCVVFDPKGELATMTYRVRSSKEWLAHCGIEDHQYWHHKNARCYVLDPFGETDGLPRSNYNLLSEIDIESDRVRELLTAISDGCVTPEQGENIHFEELAKYFIEGMIAHVLSKYPQDSHHLPFVFDLIHGINENIGVADPAKFDDLLYEMMKNNAAGGLPQQVASKILDMGDREKGSVLSTVSRSTKWMGDPAMRKHLVSSDFKFGELNHSIFFENSYEKNFNRSTIYIVLPDGLIKEQMRWLRSLISLSLVKMKNQPNKPKIPTLFILDEFPRLGGKIEVVAEGFNILRGYGIKLWAFVQNIEQIEHDYPERWTSILANSTIQVFGVNGYETAEWVSQILGSNVIQRKEKRNGRRQVAHEEAYPLLTPNEVMTKFGKSQNRQLVKTVEGFPMRLERCAYKPLDIGEYGFQEFKPNAFKFHFPDW